ncbi:MAG: hypothetical protein J5742_04080 [Alphaproteobacteria bacterium]|nr:hypothetical protein [Alphaproteobacteria bacterium]
MPRERKNFHHKLSFIDYDIAGNVFRAWRDEDGKLIVVLDETIDEYKPYALLVMDSYGDRKWDDVLSNDFNLDLEDVRPKKENKYQKLDIEYDGLDFYDQLVHAYESGTDVNAVLPALFDFRDAAVKRAATGRLVTASEVIAQSVKTATRAEHTISNLLNRQNILRTRLENQRSEIGREPAKESAAKILKTESQIEKNEEMLIRAQKRRDNANRRGDSAREDAAVAHDVLARHRPKQEIPNISLLVQKDENLNNPIVLQPTTDTKTEYVEKYDEKYEKNEEYTVVNGDENDKINTDSAADIKLPVPDYELQSETEEVKMSDTQDTEEVKPLLDKDPEILDEEIAFKPVDFEDIKTREPNNMRPVSQTETVDEYRNDSESVEVRNETVVEPLSFSETGDTNTASYDDADTRYTQDKPVLNTIHSVDEPTVSDVDTTKQVTNTQYESVTQTHTTQSAPATPIYQQQQRPISPITGERTKVQPVGQTRQKPTIVYYLLLILLIGLSIFTLWLYQKSNGGTVPLINRNGDETEVVTHPDVISSGGVFITPQEPEPTVTEQPVAEPDVPVEKTEPQVIIIREQVEKPVEDTPINVEYPNNNVLIAAEPDETIVEPEDSVLSRKEPYGVSRESQTVYVPVFEPEVEVVEEPEVRVTTVTSPDVIFDDDIVSVLPVMPPHDYDFDEEEAYYNDNGDDVGYYSESQNYYQPQRVNYEDYGQQEEYYEDNSDGGFIIESSDDTDPETRRYLSVHDGGQYSIGYTETTY